MDKNQHPLVSVAIITYNQKEFLRECIESCLEQDYQNTEIVVADDGSTDGTQDMLKEYETKYPGKFVLRLSEENKGITRNSNLAHFACSGKYIAWMGGDDLMLPGKISAQVEFMEKKDDCSICYHDMDVFDSSSNKTIYVQSKRVPQREGGLQQYIKFGCYNGACASMVRREKTPANGFNELLPLASDWLYWVESLNDGGKINYIPRVLSRYRRHDNNITRKIKTSKIRQNVVDHLNSCNLILMRYPEFIRGALYSQAMILRGVRHELPYISTLIHVIRVTGDIKSLFAVIIYCLSLKRVKL